jgi:undecaprenyl-diphosphatase
MLRKIWQFISFFGSTYISLLFLILIFFIDLNIFYNLFLVFVIAHIIVVVIRIFYFKERPIKIKHNNFFMKIYASSFPSMHAMRAIIIAYFLSTFNLNVFLIFYWLIALLVCYSRIYLKKHYFSDVLVGALFGFLISFFLF